MKGEDGIDDDLTNTSGGNLPHYGLGQTKQVETDRNATPSLRFHGHWPVLLALSTHLHGAVLTRWRS